MKPANPSEVRSLISECRRAGAQIFERRGVCTIVWNDNSIRVGMASVSWRTLKSLRGQLRRWGVPL